MAIIARDEMEAGIPVSAIIQKPKLRWIGLLAMSVLWFALNFHWAALGLIILPSQVFKIAGTLHQGQALAFVLVPGAFVSLLANPLAGMLSDRTHGNLARWGRRRPYIALGTVVNVAALLWMANTWNILTLMLAYMLVQFSSNTIAAPFHALLPDLVPAEQRGVASGAMGMLSVGGSMCGVIVAGVLVNAARPLSAYRQGVTLAYGSIIAVLVALALITLITVRERRAVTAYSDEATLAAKQLSGVRTKAQFKRSSWLSSPLLFNSLGIALLILVAWGLMTVWNYWHIGGIRIGNEVQQCLLMVLLSLAMLRLFGFHPRRNGDFAWVLVTRLVMMMGIYTIQTFLQYFMRDVMGAANPELETTRFIVIASLTSLASALVAGWLSDRFGRKRIIYCSGGLLALLGLSVLVSTHFTHSLMVLFAAGALFGVAGGAYQSVDWALVADVLPSHKDYAKDMGLWNISLSLPQVIAPVIGGPLIDTFARQGSPVAGYQALFLLAVVCCLLGTVTVRFIRGVKR